MLNQTKTKFVKHQKPNSQFLKFSGLAIQMLATILLFTFIGLKLDEWMQTKIPSWTIILSLTGIGSSLYMLIRNLPKI